MNIQTVQVEEDEAGQWDAGTTVLPTIQGDEICRTSCGTVRNAYAQTVALVFGTLGPRFSGGQESSHLQYRRVEPKQPEGGTWVEAAVVLWQVLVFSL